MTKCSEVRDDIQQTARTISIRHGEINVLKECKKCGKKSLLQTLATAES